MCVTFYFVSGLTDYQKEESASLVKAANLNLALCHLKLDNYFLARDCAAKVLEKDPNNVKALYRKAKVIMIQVI